MSTIKRSGNNIRVEASVFVYKDLDYPNGDMYIAYCPELDLAGYDTTNKKARESFMFVLKDYLDHTTKKGTLESDLLKHGWKKLKNGKDSNITFLNVDTDSSPQQTAGKELEAGIKYQSPLIVRIIQYFQN